MTFTPPAALGPFELPSPYSTRGIRLTNNSNAPQGCEPRLYSYWSCVSNHRGQGALYVVLGRIGAKPLLLTVNKTSHAVSTVRELPMEGTAEGWYWSDTLATEFYFLEGAQLRRYDVFDGRTTTVFTLDPKYGHHLWQAHSSSDDQTHSATVKDASDRDLGAIVVEQRGPIQAVTFFPDPLINECHIDKGGQYLIVEQNETQDNVIYALDTGARRTITNKEGALNHLDVGVGVMVGEDDTGDHWQMSAWHLHDGPKHVLLRGEGAWGNGLGHCAVRGAVVLVSSNETGDLMTVDMTTLSARRIAPGMIVAPPGTPREKLYDYQLRACLCPVAHYAAWIAFVDGRFDAFLVQLPGSQPLIVTPDPKPKPEPGGSMKPFPYFTSAEKAELAHDNGFTSIGVPGTFDGRDALIIPTIETLPEGNGAWVTLTWANGKGVRQHGRLYLKQEPDRATFAVDMTEEPTGF